MRIPSALSNRPVGWLASGLTLLLLLGLVYLAGSVFAPELRAEPDIGDSHPYHNCYEDGASNQYVRVYPVSSIRVTDQAQIDPVTYRYMFEFVNWTGVDVHGIVLSLNTGLNPGGGVLGVPFFSSANVDPDGRPFGFPDSNPPAGNDPVSSDNDWFVDDQTATRIEFTRNVDSIDHPQGFSGQVFHGLLDPDFAAQSQQTCVEALLQMIPGSVSQGYRGA